jgi:hypothetical protein
MHRDRGAAKSVLTVLRRWAADETSLRADLGTENFWST